MRPPPQPVEITVADRSTARMVRDHIRQWLPHHDRTDALALLDKILATEPRAQTRKGAAMNEIKEPAALPSVCPECGALGRNGCGAKWHEGKPDLPSPVEAIIAQRLAQRPMDRVNVSGTGRAPQPAKDA